MDLYATNELVEAYPQYALEEGQPVRLLYDMSGELMTILSLGETVADPRYPEPDPED